LRPQNKTALLNRQKILNSTVEQTGMRVILIAFAFSGFAIDN